MNQKPEKLVEKEVILWGELNGWSLNTVECKASYVASRGHYRSVIVSGFSDVVGCTNHGMAVFIELKALGKIKTLKAQQKDFLLEKLRHGAFAVCVDSSLLLETYYNRWVTLRASNVDDAQSYLRSLLT